MSDILDDAVERLEWDERKEEDTPVKRWRQLTRRTALSGGAAGIAATILEACGGSSSSSSSHGDAPPAAAAAPRASSGRARAYKFTFVNHVTTNPFFTPTQNGAADACKLLGCSYQWTGSQTSNVGEMVNAFNSAVSAGVNGIAVSLVDLQGVQRADRRRRSAAKIPVVAYNADAPSQRRGSRTSARTCSCPGRRWASTSPRWCRPATSALFIATPGSLNIQPRIDGAQDTLKTHPAIKTHVVATGAALPGELTTIDSYVDGAPEHEGLSSPSTPAAPRASAQTIQKHNLKGKVKGGGYDLTPVTQQLLAGGYIAVHDRPAALPAGLLPDHRAVPVQRLADPDRYGRRQHGSEVPRQDDGGAVQQHEEPLRGHRHSAPASRRRRCRTGGRMTIRCSASDGCRI